ncbi:hypothetical protein Tco_1284424, partial [Tanacetum coccineum]
ESGQIFEASCESRNLIIRIAFIDFLDPKNNYGESTFQPKWFRELKVSRGLGELAPTKLIIELADRTVKRPKGIAENVLVGLINLFPSRLIVLDMPEDIKTPFILERMELDLEARLMGEALILNRSVDLLYGDNIELNDLNEPLELRRNRVDNLEPTIKEGGVVNELMMDIVNRCDDEIIDGLDEYPSYCDFDRKIHID